MTNFLQGNFVNVVRKSIPSAWTNVWITDMDKYVGNGVSYSIQRVLSEGLCLDVGGPNYTFPEECCELANLVVKATISTVSAQVLDKMEDPHGLIAQRRALREFLGDS